VPATMLDEVIKFKFRDLCVSHINKNRAGQEGKGRPLSVREP
jgi:hypothetical protein